MSLMRAPLNLYLRLTERPHLRRASSPERLRRSFERKARLFFHGPRGMSVMPCDAGGRPALRIARKGTQPDAMILYFHGGGYVFGSPRTHAPMLATLANMADCAALLPDYRKAPEHPHPAAINDAEAAYLDILAQGQPPAQMVLGGDSAGGGLALALLARIIARGHPMPAGLFAFSPLTDLTDSSASIRDNAASDVVLPAQRVTEMTEAFIGQGDRKDPSASPLYAEFTGACPVWLTAGSTEILRDDSRNMDRALRAQGVPVTYVEKHDLPHVWPIFHNILPEARATLRAVAAFVQTSFDSASR